MNLLRCPNDIGHIIRMRPEYADASTRLEARRVLKQLVPWCETCHTAARAFTVEEVAERLLHDVRSSPAMTR